jgi:regulator of Ty1 transposition protein 109
MLVYFPTGHSTKEMSSSSSPSSPKPNLRDHLLAALSTLPGTREHHLHVLVSAPRKSNGLFPFASPPKPPRVYLQDILVLCSERALTDEDAPRVIVSAIEASVYVVPPTKCAVFYVSKVDSTGQGSKPAPTSTLVRALIGYYVDARTRPVQAEHVWVQLFARAQEQYLFPNSKEWSGKKALGDTGLCAWWKRVLTKVVLDLEGKDKEKEKEKEKEKGKMKLKMYYILPGFSQDEAEHALRIATPASATALEQPQNGVWEYGHPYSQTDIPLPCVPPDVDGKMKNLGHFIPSFDDDPKSRFMDEIAYTTDGDIKSPQRKRARTNTNELTRTTTRESSGEEQKPLGELNKVTADEFWERMSFRQECVAGAVTGFFSVMVSSVPEGLSGESPLAPQAGQVAGQVHKRIMTTLLTGVEFSNVERAVKGTETVEGAIRGLCEGIPTTKRPRTPEPKERLLVAPSTPPRRRRVEAEVSPNPFPEPVASLETYRSHIYGSVETRNAMQAKPEPQKGVAVTVLSVRRKNRLIK